MPLQRTRQTAVMTTAVEMNHDPLFAKPKHRAEINVGVVCADRETSATFHERCQVILLLDFEQALELQRCLVAAMQQKFTGNELLQVDLEPGVVEIIPNAPPVPIGEMHDHRCPRLQDGNCNCGPGGNDRYPGEA